MAGKLNVILQKHNISHPEYETLLAKLQRDDGEPDGEGEPESEKPPQSDRSSAEEEALSTVTVRKLKLNENNLRRAWEVSQKSTKVPTFEFLLKITGRLGGVAAKVFC